MKRNLYALYFKRAIDLTFGTLMLLGIMAIFPITLLMMLLVRLDSPQETIIFSQERIGKNCLPFTIYKLRSMRFGKQISLLGKILRRTKIDEYPQFINLLKGDMSLIGPRAMQKIRLDDYFTAAEQKRRLVVRPGLIPSAPRRKTGEAKVKIHDLSYIPSLKNDIMILLTVLPTYFLRDHG